MKKLLLTLALLCFGLAHAYDLETVFWYRDTILQGSGFTQVNCDDVDYLDTVRDQRIRLLPRDHYTREVTFCLAPAEGASQVGVLVELEELVRQAIAAGPFAPTEDAEWLAVVPYPEYRNYSLRFLFPQYFEIGVSVSYLGDRELINLRFTYYLSRVEEGCSWSILEHEPIRSCE